MIHIGEALDLALMNLHLSITKYVCMLSCVWLFATPGTVAYQSPLYTKFSRLEYWNGLPFPSPGGIPDPGIKPGSPTL